MTKRKTKTLIGEGSDVLAMIYGALADANNATLTAVGSIVLGSVTEVVDEPDTFEIRLTTPFPQFTPVPVETLFTAFQTFLLENQRAGFNNAEREAARDSFKRTVGPLAALIDWSEK